MARVRRPGRWVQSAGYAYRLPRLRVKEEFNRHGQLLMLMLRYTQALISQVSQTAVFNRHHSIDQQICRWLLLSMDRLSHNHLTMIQEFIAPQDASTIENLMKNADKAMFMAKTAGGNQFHFFSQSAEAPRSA